MTGMLTLKVSTSARTPMITMIIPIILEIIVPCAITPTPHRMKTMTVRGLVHAVGMSYQGNESSSRFIPPRRGRTPKSLMTSGVGLWPGPRVPVIAQAPRPIRPTHTTSRIKTFTQSPLSLLVLPWVARSCGPVPPLARYRSVNTDRWSMFLHEPVDGSSHVEVDR